MFKPVPEEELKKAGCKDKQTCIKVQYTYYRDESIKPTVDCWLPPRGWIYDYMNQQWKYIGVYRRSVKDADCYWEIDPRFEEYRNTWEVWENEQDERRKKDTTYAHPQIAKSHPELKYLKQAADVSMFKNQCWLYRLGGFWFRNNGEDTYITGKHWNYLSVYKIDVPIKYRKKDRLFHYFWQYCEEDPECFGTNYIDKRRGGKTFISGNIALENTTRSEQYHTGIQSKTEEDARKSVFNKAVIKPYKKYPRFFRPVSNLPKGNAIPASGLIFNSGKMDGRGDELESFIDYKSSHTVAYDGEKLNFGIFDEEGKATEVNVYDRWLIAKYCFLDDEGRIIGKSLHTTTVEEMDAGGRPFMALWRESDQGKKTGKRTVSGLYKWFTPAYKARNIDKYGDCDEEDNKRIILEEFELLKNNPRALASARRKEPFCEEDAFLSDGQSCVFDPMLIENRIDDLQWLTEKPYLVGNFHWKDNIFGGEVLFIENPNGRFMVKWMPEEDKRNRKLHAFNRKFPGATETAVAGVDTYDHRKLKTDTENVLSLGSISVIKKPDPINPSEFDNTLVCGYLNRPDGGPKVFYEDVLKCLIFYGCLALIETNKPGLSNWLDEIELEGYSALLPGKTERGINNAGTSAINNLIGELIEQYITEHIDKIWFLQLLEQFRDFTPADTTKYDFCMSFGYALMLMQNPISRLRREIPQKDIKDYISWA